MMKRTIAAASVLAALGVTAVALQPEEMEMPDMEQMMALQMQKSMPGEHHKILKKMEGEWDMVMTWKAPTGEVVWEATGECESELILGGRQLVSEVEMESEDGPFEGLGILGYDNIKEEFTSFWTDTMTTGHMAQTGSLVDGHITVEGTSVSVMGESKLKNVYKIVDKDHFELHFWEPSPMTGEYYAAGVIKYTRTDD